MPLTSAFTSRTLVRKFNPNHGSDGRFASDGGGRRGGTEGPPTEDAFGNPLSKHSGGTQRSLDVKQTTAAHSQVAQQVASHVHGMSDEGLGPVDHKLNEYILSQESKARPGETLNQYVDRRNALLKIRHSRGL